MVWAAAAVPCHKVEEEEDSSQLDTQGYTVVVNNALHWRSECMADGTARPVNVNQRPQHLTTTQILN